MTQPVPQEMTAQQYIAAQAAINLAAIQALSGYLGLYENLLLNNVAWVRLLEFLFPTISRFRTESASLARRFFDSEYQRVLPNEPRHDVLLQDEMDFPWFVQKMEPARKKFIREESVQNDSDRVLARIVQVIEEAGRNTVVQGVEQLNQEIVDGERNLISDQPEETLSPDAIAEDLKRRLAGEAGRPVRREKVTSRNQVVGWARVATGRETCAFCLTLVSRGPVYRSASSAGLKLKDGPALDSFLGSSEVSEWMTQWHPNCDCKVVPVFNPTNWVGESARKRALSIWKDQTGNVYGKDKLNAFRREVERGDVNVSEFAID